MEVYTGDLIAMSEGDKNDVLSGYYSSRPGLKKNIKDASSLFHAHNKLFSKEILGQSVNDAEVQAILTAKSKVLDVLGLENAHNFIEGAIREPVLLDNEKRLVESLDASSKIYKKLIIKEVER
jgi:hypothetical protein